MRGAVLNVEANPTPSPLVRSRVVFTCTVRAVLALALLVPLLASETSRTKAASGPVYVPLTSWMYPVFKRLAALGYMPDEERLTLPWTREQCRILVDEAEDIAARHSTKVAAGLMNEEALRLISALRAEFPPAHAPTAEFRVESIYTAMTHIGGLPLSDSYHLGQTLVNNYGRPYANGLNTDSGFSAYGSAGRFSGYFRGEYQTAGIQPAYSQSVQNFFAIADGVPAQPAIAVSATSRFEPMEMYVGLELAGLNVTVGKQSMWWGSGDEGALHFSTNAEPIYSVRIAQETPIVLPGFLRFLGHVRTQFVLGKLAGHSFPPGPLINAEKITFQLTENLEFGFTRSAIFGGAGHPITAGTLLQGLTSVSSTGGTFFGSSSDPGDRRSGFDFSWRVPGLRRFVTIYSDSLADDEPSPLASPHRSAWGPGVYLTQLPKLKKLDFRFETYSTWLYRGDEGGRFFYWNTQYRDAYTNEGNLIGGWVGRDARAYVASSTYWWSAQNKITANYRQTKTGSQFLPGGGTQTDASLALQWQIRPSVVATTLVQYERYYLPLIGPSRSDVTAGMQFVFYPKNWSTSRR